MRYFTPDPDTRAGDTIPAIALPSAFIDASDICNRAINEALGYPLTRTDKFLERGAAGATLWMECPDSLWATVSPHLTTAELATETSTEPASYARNSARNRMSVFAGKVNLIAITDSLGMNGGSGDLGLDSYVTKAFQQWAGATITPLGGYAPAEYITTTKALLHHGKGGSFYGGVNNTDIQNDHEWLRAIRYSTMQIDAADTIYVSLGTNDFSNDGAGLGSNVWARAQTFLGGLRASFPSTRLLVGTMVRRGESTVDHGKYDDFNDLLKAGYVALGVDALVDIESAHANFSLTATGDSTGEAY